MTRGGFLPFPVSILAFRLFTGRIFEVGFFFYRFDLAYLDLGIYRVLVGELGILLCDGDRFVEVVSEDMVIANDDFLRFDERPVLECAGFAGNHCAFAQERLRADEVAAFHQPFDIGADGIQEFGVLLGRHPVLLIHIVVDQ